MTAEIAEAHAMAEGNTPGRRHAAATTPAWLWLRAFPGTPEQVTHARHWVERLLPECDPRAILALVTSEFCTNAVTHTRSGAPGGQVTVHLAWSPGTVRLTVGDQGSPKPPEVVTALLEQEHGRGLSMVNAMTAGWGFADGSRGRWVWADLPWLSGGGPERIASDGALPAAEAVRGLRRAYPGIRVGYAGAPAMWWATLPGDSYPDDRLAAPCFGALSQVTAAAWAARGPGAA